MSVKRPITVATSTKEIPLTSSKHYFEIAKKYDQAWRRRKGRRSEARHHVSGFELVNTEGKESEFDLYRNRGTTAMYMDTQATPSA